jgi:hypothetical protein
MGEVVKPKVSKTEALQELWRRGNLIFLLDKNQKELYKLFHESGNKIQTWLLARRSGKTRTLCVLALEMCLRNPKAIVKFVSPTRLQVQTNIRPLIRDLLETCPKELRPEFKTQDFIYYFPNGAELQLAGSENKNVDKLRGGSSHIAIIDEAQDVSGLDYAIKSVLLPTTLTTGGKVLLAGTPPQNMDHDFIGYIEKATTEGVLTKKTIFDNPRMTPEQIEEVIAQYPLREKDVGFRREFMCELIKDESIAVIPEFTDDLKKSIIKEWPRPPYFDAYVTMDLGAIDLTGLVFGYYDFRANKIIIEDELVVDFSKKDMNITKLTDLIQAKEAELWTNKLTNEVKPPYMRTSDINFIVTQEIAAKSFNKIYFQTTKKDDKEAAINNMRTLLGTGKIIIHPRCINLIRHLDNVKWASAKNKQTFGRSPDNGHYDLVDALIYMTRTVQYGKNPYPANYDLGRGDIFVPNMELYNSQQRSKASLALQSIFGNKKR